MPLCNCFRLKITYPLINFFLHKGEPYHICGMSISHRNSVSTPNPRGVFLNDMLLQLGTERSPPIIHLTRRPPRVRGFIAGIDDLGTWPIRQIIQRCNLIVNRRNEFNRIISLLHKTISLTLVASDQISDISAARLPSGSALLDWSDRPNFRHFQSIGLILETRLFAASQIASTVV